MGWEAWFTLGMIVLIIVALVRNWGPADAIILGAAVILGAVGVLRPAEVFSGFMNSGMLTVAALFVVAAAMRETGALDRTSQWLLGRSNTEFGVLFKMGIWVTTASAFLNNTPIVAMFAPMIATWCRNHRVSPSKLLLPLSYFAILGGTCTLIGTSTNLVVNGLMIDAAATHPEYSVELRHALRPMTLFELTWIGVPYAVVGVIYMLFVGRRILPDRKDLIESLGESMREYLVDMRVEPGCRLIGHPIEAAGLRHLPGLFLIEIERGGRSISPVGPHEIVEEGDILTFTGVVSTIVDLERIPGLVPHADDAYETRARERRSKSLCEAVISQTSPLIGKNVRDADFRALYNAAIIAVHRNGVRLKGRVGDIVLRNGDTLLLQAGPHFARAHRNNPDFFLVSDLEEARPARHERATLSLVLLAFLVAALSFGGPDYTALVAFLVAGLMVATRCISATAARQSVELQILLTIAGSLALGLAVDKSGLASAFGKFFVEQAGGLSPYLTLLLVYLSVNAITDLITNNAAAALTFPFVIAIAQQQGLDPRPFIMAVTLGASASFCTPIGYQTNLMVYGPGGYKFTDFTKVGIPLALALALVATVVIPLVWPF